MNPSSIPVEVKEIVASHSFEGQGCWIWDGATRASGSPVIEYDSQLISAKMAFYHFLTEPLEDLDSNKVYRFYMGACDNKLCVKPELYSHVVVKECNIPSPRLKKDRELKTVPWDRNRILRYYYGHENFEEDFQVELSKYHDTICELINTCVDHFEENKCIRWHDLLTHYKNNIQYKSDFVEVRGTYTLKANNKLKMFPLPVKRALYVYWQDLEPHFLLNGIHWIFSGCGDKECHAPWHMKATIRTPGTRNAKTDWIS